MTDSLIEGSTEALRDRIAVELDRARNRTLALTGAIDDVELTRQHSELMSPLVWDLAHIGNQEELWLLRELADREAILPATIDELYDAFRHPRRDRPTLPLLDPGESRRYVREVRGRVTDLLERAPLEGRNPLTRGGFVFGMVAQHEQQHVETMYATHQLRVGAPALDAPPPPAATGPALPAEVLIPGGDFDMGTDLEAWALDNERPAHRAAVPAFFLDTTPVTNAAYAEFVAAGGYADQRFWHPNGWAHIRSAEWDAPQFWRREGAGWVVHRFGVDVELAPDQPVQHVCWYEAEAYARWAGRRLPTETEWEKAARHDPATGRSRRFPWGDDEPTAALANLGGRHLGPASVGAYPAGASPLGVHQLIGDVWEWTASDFTPYPGFRAFPYREYSEVFFAAPGQQGEYKVLRGGSWAVDNVACRGTFRNWDYPTRRQIFAGFRTARSAGPEHGHGRTARSAGPEHGHGRTARSAGPE
ncbi:ergothioneine biosynthesis protein EgtB, partial [Sporichthya sp.]|uniref:ergothioneine biosynthesis protein EgtB n=1 Tax=Sporichthya sp. TaxID=65475 RepID=UPI0017AE8E42|nr:ergothioneine biosynthesis protein EgtB [Sporichthya sp.]